MGSLAVSVCKIHPPSRKPGCSQQSPSGDLAALLCLAPPLPVSDDPTHMFFVALSFIASLVLPPQNSKLFRDLTCRRRRVAEDLLPCSVVLP